jgi:Uncharacterized protein conserved in bacteria (DUF2188)
MEGGAVHTIQRGGEWINQIGEEGQAGPGFWTKEEAQRAGRELAKRLKVPHLVYNQYGTLEEHNSDWNDRREVSLAA